MYARELSVTDEYLLRPEHGADWRSEIEAFADRRGIDGAAFHGQGTVSDADLWTYDRTDREFRSVRFDEGLSMPACLGTVSIDETGARIADVGAVLARPSGQALAGRLAGATAVSGRLSLRAFAEPIERRPDERTGLHRLQ